MAINKQRMSTSFRVAIVIICLMLVVTLIPWGALGIFGNNNRNVPGSQDAIASRHRPGVEMLQAQLASDPTSYTVLVGIGRAYSVWASEVMMADTAGVGSDSTIWSSAATYFDRALEVAADNPADMMDASIARYYSGNVAGAIELAEAVWAIDPEFAPSYFNAGIFFETAGRTADAIAAYTRYLELDPQGTGPGDPSVAQAAIARLSAVVTTPAVGATVPPTP